MSATKFGRKLPRNHEILPNLLRNASHIESRTLYLHHTVSPVVGQRRGVGVEGAPGEAEGEEGARACLGLGYLRKTMHGPVSPPQRLETNTVAMAITRRPRPLSPRQKLPLCKGANPLTSLPSSLNRKRFHHHTVQNRKQRALHPLWRNLRQPIPPRPRPLSSSSSHNALWRYWGEEQWGVL